MDVENAINQYAIVYPSLREVEHPLLKRSDRFRWATANVLQHCSNQFRGKALFDESRVNAFVEDLKAASGEISMPEAKRLTLLRKGEIEVSHWWQRLTWWKHRKTHKVQFFFDLCYLLGIRTRTEGEAVLAELQHLGLDDPDDGAVLDGMLGEAEIPEVVPRALVTAWKRIFAFLTQQPVRVAVVAPMSAGKSTLLNAMIGKRLLPSKGTVCTRVISEIWALPEKRSEDRLLALQKNGGDALCETVETDASTIRKALAKGGSPAVLAGWVGALSGTGRTVLLDTPGDTSKEHPEHKEITWDFLSSAKVNIAIFVLRCTSYQRDETTHSLERLKTLMQSRNVRVLFALTEMDECKLEENSLETLVKGVKDRLSSLGFASPVVCPLSALIGLTVRSGKCREEDGSLDVRAAQFLDSDWDLSRFYEGCSLAAPVTEEEKIFRNCGLEPFEAVLKQTISETTAR